MKCKCRSESEGHAHKAGECQNDVVDGLVCPKCQALDTLGLGWEVHVEGPEIRTALGCAGGGREVRRASQAADAITSVIGTKNGEPRVRLFVC